MTGPSHPARVWAYLGAATLTSGALSALRPLYVTSLMREGAELGDMGLLTGGLRIFSFLGAPLIGLLLDKVVGVRRGTVGGLGVMLAGAALAIVPYAPLISILSLVLLTLGELFARVGLLVLLADAHPPASPGRASVFLLRHVGLNFSFLGLPAVSSILFMTVGMTVPAIGATAICAGALALLLLTPEQEESAPEPVQTSAYGLLAFSMLGLSTSTVNVVMDAFTTARIDPSTATAVANTNFIQLLNPVIVVMLGVPVALMWTRARLQSVGRFGAGLAGAAFILCAVQALFAFASNSLRLPASGTLATLNLVSAVVEVLAWPLSTALVSSVAPLRWRASYLGIWVAISGMPFGLGGTERMGSAASPALIAGLGVLSIATAGFILAARGRIASYVSSLTPGEALRSPPDRP